MLDSSSMAILLGYSGHGYVVADAALEVGIQIIGYAENRSLSRNPYDLNYLGDETENAFDWQLCSNYILGVGANGIRARISARVKSNRGKCLTVIHPSASVARNVRIGTGTFIARNVSMNPLVSIGESVILNTACIIDHECNIENNVHVAPGAVLAGNVRVKEGAFIGANSIVKEGITIGENAIIGAGSVVVRNVPSAAKVFGNPAHYNRK